MQKSPPLIAVVDDEESVRRALHRLLRSAGFETLDYASGHEFLRHCEGHAPDCVVLDLHLRGHTGFDVQQALALAGLPIPVVVLTATDTSRHRARALANGAQAYLTKPIDDEKLIDAIVSALHSRTPRA